MAYDNIRDHLDGDTTINPERWRLILEWCITAAQEKNDSSLLNIGTTEPALCQDPEFLDWCERHLNFTLGEEVRVDTVAQRDRGEGRAICTWLNKSPKTWDIASSRGYKPSPKQLLAPPGKGAAQRTTMKSEGAYIPKTTSPR